MHDETTLNSALNDAIEHWPNRVFLKIDGQDITFSQFEDQVGRLAAGLSDICGINAGDRVSVFMRNSLACEHTWFSANRLGAIWVPINTEFRGGLSLEHAVNLADAQVYVVDEDLYEILTTALFKAGIDATVVVASNEDAKGNGLWLSDLYLDRKAPPLSMSSSQTSRPFSIPRERPGGRRHVCSRIATSPLRRGSRFETSA